MRHRLVVTGLVLLAAMCAGCFDYTEEFVINQDGSGTRTVRIAMDKALIDVGFRVGKEYMASAGEDTLGVDSLWNSFSSESIKEKLADDGDGVRLISFDSTEANGQVIFTIKLAFDDINAAYGDLAEASGNKNMVFPGDEWFAGKGVPREAEPEPDSALKEPPRLFAQQADGTWLFERKLSDDSIDYFGVGDEAGTEADHGTVAAVEDTPPSSAQTLEDITPPDSVTAIVDTMSGPAGQYARDMMALVTSMGRHNVRLSVTFPGDIVETNATTVDGRTAIWEMKLMQFTTAFTSLRAVVKM